MPFLARLVCMKRRRRWRTHAVADGLTANSGAKRKGFLCGHGEKSGCAKRTRLCLILDKLPQDVLQNIIALLPMQDAARAASVSRELLQSWRCYPELEFSTKTLALNEQQTCVRGRKAREILSRIDGILKSRSGAWVKRLKFELRFLRKVPTNDMDRWLAAAAPGVEEHTLELPRHGKVKYRLRCKLFSDEKGYPIQSLCLNACAFHPDQSCNFRSLKRMYLSLVHINTEEIESFLANSLALEHLELWHCHELASLKLPCTLQWLSFLRVGRCDMLQMIHSDAPSLSTFHYEGAILPFSFGDSLNLKDIGISVYPWLNLFNHARIVLPTVAPNLETLFLLSAYEEGKFFLSSLVPGKFLHLKYLELAIVGPMTQMYFDYEYLSLVPFLNSSPALETFILHAEESAVLDFYLVTDTRKWLRGLPRHHHKSIKHVTITGFCPASELMVLIFHILENAVSLQSLTLDSRIRGFEKDLVARISQDTTTRDFKEWHNSFVDNEETLWYTRRADLNWVAYIAHKCIISYIIGRVPSSVKLKILSTPPVEDILSISKRQKEHGNLVVCPHWENYISSLSKS